MTSIRVSGLLRGLGSFLLLALLLLGPPIGLALAVGWPLPTAVPSFDEVEQAVRAGVDDAVVVKALAVLAWVLWGQVALAIVSEVSAAARGRSARMRSLIPGLQAAIGQLVGGTALVVTSLTPLHAAGAAPAKPQPVAQLVPIPSLAATASRTALEVAPPAAEPRAESADPAPGSADDSQTVLVRRHDSWWAIAERTLGDGLRWSELRDLNVGRTMPDGHTIAAGSDLLRPGWVVRLPADATAAADDSTADSGPDAQSANVPPPQVGDAGSEVAPSDVTVTAGDSMWRIAERELSDALGRPASTPETAIYWASFVDANRDRFVDSTNADLIHIGQRLALPPLPGVLAPSAPASAAIGLEPEQASAPNGSHPAPERPEPSSTELPEAPDVATTPDATASPNSTDVTTAPTPPATPSSDRVSTTAEPSEPPPTVQDRDGNMDQGDDTARSPVPLVAVATSSLLAVGAVRAVRRARRRRDHLAPGSSPLATSDPVLHRQLVVDADEEQVDVLADALNSLAAGAAEASQRCRPLVVQHGPDHLDVLLDEPARPAIDGWQAQGDGEVWAADLSRQPAGGESRQGSGAATPLLVTVGRPDDGGQMYLDLEAARLVTITGEGDSAQDLLVTMAVELANSPLAANAQVVIVGEDIGAARLGDLDRVRAVPTWAEVAPDLVAWNDQSRNALVEHDWPNAFIARGHDADHDALIPLVVIAAEPPDDLDVLGVLPAAPAATAVVVIADPLPGATIIDCRGDRISLPQLGLTCRPLSIDGADADALAGLIDSAGDTAGDRIGTYAEAHETDAPGAGMNGTEPYRDRPYEILVRFLGDITVEGGSAPLTGKQTALVAYIALHASVSADRVSDSVWISPAAVSHRKRLANTITKCRTAIGARHLPAARDGRYSIGPDVATDVEIFERRTAAASAAPPEQAADLLRSAVDLVQGPVFSYASTERDSYSWVDVENWISTWELKVTNTAERAAGLYLDLGDAGAAVQVAERILRAVPTHAGLTEVLMRAHAANGDRLALQRVYQAHLNALDQLDLDSVADSTAELYERLRAG